MTVVEDKSAVAGLLDAFAERHGSKRKASNFAWKMNNVFFRDLELAGRHVLDVGCGTGDMALWAAAHGATAVGLEPEAAGSGGGGAQAIFAANTERLGLVDRTRMVPSTLEDFAAKSEMFDIILMAASINHIDEEACTKLHQDERARSRYREHLRKLYELAAPGGTLVVSDGDRRNVFAALGRRNPLAPTIEWEKHQHPKLWAGLLADVGFEQPAIRWLTLTTLREPGQWLLGNRVAAYFTTSVFVLTMRRPPA